MGEELAITEADRDTVVPVRIGVVVVVRLAENPTTGYRWVASPDPQRVELRGHRFSPQSAATGAGGVHEFQLLARQLGRIELRFELRRQWEQSPKTVFRVTLQVTQ